MDIRQLKYFVAIAKAGSLSAAAQKLQTAQPSLSQHLVNMEQELDVRLVTWWSPYHWQKQSALNFREFACTRARQ